MNLGDEVCVEGGDIGISEGFYLIDAGPGFSEKPAGIDTERLRGELTHLLRAVTQECEGALVIAVQHMMETDADLEDTLV